MSPKKIGQNEISTCNKDVIYLILGWDDAEQNNLIIFRAKTFLLLIFLQFLPKRNAFWRMSNINNVCIDNITIKFEGAVLAEDEGGADKTGAWWYSQMQERNITSAAN